MSALPDPPAPRKSALNEPYWQGLREGRLVVQSCANCRRIRHYPRPVCPSCYSMAVDWIDASLTGKVHSWMVAYHPFHPGFKGKTPYTLITADMDDGFRVVAPLVGAGDLQIGADVAIEFNRVNPDLALPQIVLSRS